ncbi:IS701 family transposase [Sulfuricaulis sp.]|uniref:IS701 family transposase n=1 Tax=Sulfuricaulis sp. TaxID=2003553 RepID=UPI003C756485
MSEIETVEGWASELKVLGSRIGRRFERSEPRERAIAYLKGLMSDVHRKNGWQLAEQAGEATPDGMQRLLSTAVWDVEGVRDDLRDYVVETLGSEHGVLVLDESGFLKKGTHSVGVKRQYSGTAGRVENCQVGVFLGYASEKGQALIDRALYLPQEWVADAERCREAKIPEDMPFATKPELGRQMLGCAFAAGVPARWVTGDSIYGGDRRLRLWLEEQGRWFVLGIRKDDPLWSGFYQRRADARAAALPGDAWQRLSCGAGAKGPRVYDWALLLLPRWGQSADVLHALLVRRSVADGELGYFVVFAPAGTSLQTLVTIAGMRWTIEECFEVGKNETGLDEYEVRHWLGWYRHITLSMLALAFLSTTRCQALHLDGTKKQVACGG